METLAEYASCSERAARDAVGHLAKVGLIALSRRDGHTTTYTILLDSWPQRAIKEVVQPLQGCSDCTHDEIAGVQPLHPRGAAIAGVGVQPLHPRGAAIAPEDAIEETNLKKPIEDAKGERGPQTIHGTQATIVLPEPPSEESPLLELLINAGMAGGYAAQVATKLVDAGITDPRTASVDEFDLGRIVGSARKNLTIQAMRAGGWLPPSERRQRGSSAMPSRASGGLSAAERVWKAANELDSEESRRMA